jgi:hypothetical protein
MSNFWIVSSHDFVRHDSGDSAVREAHRLRGKTGKPFHVYRVKEKLVPGDEPGHVTLLSDGVPRWRHLKRGSVYTEVGRALVQNSGNVALGDDAMMVIYRSASGDLYARPVAEFEDGRFESVEQGPAYARQLDPHTIEVLARAMRKLAPDLAETLAARWREAKEHSDLERLLRLLRKAPQDAGSDVDETK